MTKTTKKGFKVPEGFPIPLNRSVILEKQALEQKTTGGIILQEGSQDNNVAIMMAFAPDCASAPMFYPGAKVMYNVMENREILFEDNRYLIMHEQSVFCVLPEKAVLLVESIDKRTIERGNKQAKEKKRLEEIYKQEMNNLDKVKDQAKRKFNKKK